MFMNDIRLNTIYNLIRDGVGVADIGTDHGYIPCNLAENGYTGNIFATDINIGPLNKAIENAANRGLADRISFKLCDGIDPALKNMVDTFVIAGMGGETICSIMDSADDFYSDKYTFIFQPMTKAEILRYWLINNGFQIEFETTAYDGRLYSIFTARFGGRTVLSDLELYTGKTELIADDSNYSLLLEKLEKKLEPAAHNGAILQQVLNDIRDKRMLIGS